MQLQRRCESAGCGRFDGTGLAGIVDTADVATDFLGGVFESDENNVRADDQLPFPIQVLQKRVYTDLHGRFTTPGNSAFLDDGVVQIGLPQECQVVHADRGHVVLCEPACGNGVTTSIHAINCPPKSLGFS